MKTKEQIKSETTGTVFTLEKFMYENNIGGISPYDGDGFFHDGENETNISVWGETLTWNDVKDYPYICWYNK